MTIGIFYFEGKQNFIEKYEQLMHDLEIESTISGSYDECFLVAIRSVFMHIKTLNINFGFQFWIQTPINNILLDFGKCLHGM